MQKIDRLGWAAGTCIDAYGLRIGVRVNDAVVLGKLPELLPPGWKPSPSCLVDEMYSFRLGGQPRPGVRSYNLLFTGVGRLARTMDLQKAYDILEADLRQRVAAGARRMVFVHAGVVAWRDRAILLPGRSGSGKTTLVAALLRAGASYYSDEFAVLDERGRVHPFAKALSIKEPTVGGIARARPETLGSVAGEKTLPVGLVVFARFRPGGRWRPRRLTSGQGLLAMLAHTVPVRRRPQAALSALQRAAGEAVLVKSWRGEAEHVADAVLRLLD